ncbi:MAG: hypothetical protein U0223_14730 [Nitrospira sp.]|nr:hypothetical protein [Nitrospira sp.]
MICILCSPEDTHALWLARQLQTRGRQVELVLPEEVLIKSDLRLSIGTNSTHASLCLSRGLTLDNRLAGLINRLHELPPVVSTTGRAADSLFLAEEWRAAVAAFLEMLTCPVLNRPTGANLYGQCFSDGHWRSLAAQVGFAVAPWSSEETDQTSLARAGTNHAFAFVVGSRVVDPFSILADRDNDRLCALARLANIQLCRADFYLSSGRPVFTRLTPLPPFATGGDALVAAIDETLVESR